MGLVRNVLERCFAPRRNAAPGALTWPRDLSGHCARAMLIGSRSLLVENHRGIAELTDHRVRLNSGCGEITVTGSDLALREVRKDALIIEGELCSIDLPSGGERAE